MLSLPARLRSLLSGFRRSDALNDDMEAEFRLREARGLRRFDSLRLSTLDLKLGGRMLVKHPGLTVVGTIAVAFAIAIGATASSSPRSSVRLLRLRWASVSPPS